MDEEKKEIITCEICGEYSGDKRQVNMHKQSCKPKNAEERERPAPERKERIPFGVPVKKLNAPEGDGYHYRIFNDNWTKEPGRIQRAIQAGYEKVEGREPISVGTNEDGSPIKGILMRIPQELYNEDQKLKQIEVDRVDKAIKGGKFKEQPEDNRYIPDGIRIWSSQNENR